MAIRWINDTTIEYEADNIKTDADNLVLNKLDNIKSIIIIDGKDPFNFIPNKIPAYCFASFKNVTTITFKVTRSTTIGEGAFRGCTSLSNIEFLNIPNNITITFEERVFELTAIKKLCFPKCNLNFKEKALSDMSNLEHIIFNKSQLTGKSNKFLFSNRNLNTVEVYTEKKDSIVDGTIYLDTLINTLLWRIKTSYVPCKCNIKTNNEILLYNIKDLYKNIFNVNYVPVNFDNIIIFED